MTVTGSIVKNGSMSALKTYLESIRSPHTFNRQSCATLLRKRFVCRAAMESLSAYCQPQSPSDALFRTASKSIDLGGNRVSSRVTSIAMEYDVKFNVSVTRNALPN